jgi:hypothetical protein
MVGRLGIRDLGNQTRGSRQCFPDFQELLCSTTILLEFSIQLLNTYVKSGCRRFNIRHISGLLTLIGVDGIPSH